MKRDTKSEPDQKLKDSNRKLKGELLKARKKIRILQVTLKKYTDLDETLLREPDQIELEKLFIEPKCPRCGTGVIDISAGLYTIHVCDSYNCNYKKKIYKGSE